MRTIIAPHVCMTSHGLYRFNWDAPSETSPNLSNGVKVVDLAAEGRRLIAAQDPERTARTLVKLDTLRLTLMSLKSGAKVKQHHTDHELCIHTVTGHVSIRTPQDSFELPPGHVAILERGVMHDIEAHEESAILVTVGMWHSESESPGEADSPPAED
jgi:quercetin dioxygenase-like cupin family protein